jgi:hypothetical protein
VLEGLGKSHMFWVSLAAFSRSCQTCHKVESCGLFHKLGPPDRGKLRRLPYAEARVEVGCFDKRRSEDAAAGAHALDQGLHDRQQPLIASGGIAASCSKGKRLRQRLPATETCLPATVRNLKTLSFQCLSRRGVLLLARIQLLRGP